MSGSEPNDIIDLYDRMADNQEELDRGGHPELARVVRECANKMAEALDAHGSHKIGLGRMEKEDGKVSLTNDEKLITVCAECKMACCWQGIFMCDDAVSADVIKMSIGDLRKLGMHEHPSYWLTDEELAEL